jgi:hypothetical protein
MGGRRESRTNIDQRNQMSVKASKWGSEYWLILHKEYAQLSDGFIRAVNDLFGDLDTPGRWRNPTNQQLLAFYEQYGTHYALSTLYGGRCWLEQFYDSKMVANAIATGFTAGYEKSVSVGVGGKGVSLSTEAKTAVNFERGESQATKQAESKGTREFHYSGGAGGSFELWDVGENKKLVPIKVDLRPIDEVFVPRLFLARTKAEANEVLRRRKRVAEHLRNLLRRVEAKPDLSNLNATVDSRAPVVYEVQVESALMTDNADDASGDADVYGTIQFLLKVDGKEVDQRDPNRVDNRGEYILRGLVDGQVSGAEAYYQAWKVEDGWAKDQNGGRLPGINSRPRRFVIPPTFDLDRNGFVRSARHELDRYQLGLLVILADEDGGGNEDDLFASSEGTEDEDGKKEFQPIWYSLKLIVDGIDPASGKSAWSVPNAATGDKLPVTLRVSVEKVPFEEDEVVVDDLPDVPGLKDWNKKQ